MYPATADSVNTIPAARLVTVPKVKQLMAAATATVTISFLEFWSTALLTSFANHLSNEVSGKNGCT